MNVANDSLSHRSSHQRIVTRSPNHMWASSWSTTSARVEALRLGGQVAEQEAVMECDRTHVLHGACVELGHEQLVVLVEREWLVEQVREEPEALARHLEQLCGLALHEPGHRAPGVEAQGDAVALFVDGVPLAGHERQQVGAEAGRTLEPVSVPTVR